ncbi:MAG: hypothetical protein KIH08_15325 [Candidatus Freyarchaeota archaeon]|nr:hypothetical protein [Candidatus Jordarchaeia archaeon]MBS7268993.1 hypothetical protein [Candidatus Jordarchaeia archaeon]
MVVYGIYVKDHTGKTLFSKKFSNPSIPDSVFPSLMTAALTLFTKSREKSFQIVLSNIKFIIEEFNRIIFIAATDTKTEFRKELLNIGAVFIKTFEGKFFLLGDLLSGISTPEIEGFESIVGEEIAKSEREEKLRRKPKRILEISRLLAPRAYERNEILKKFGREGIDVLLISEGNYRINQIAKILEVDQSLVEKIINFAYSLNWLTFVPE